MARKRLEVSKRVGLKIDDNDKNKKDQTWFARGVKNISFWENVKHIQY